MEAEKTESEISELPYITIGTTGLRKQIIKKGVSWQTPIPGDEIEVHYSVKLQDDEYFDSSREKGTTFRFKLDQGEVIKGWDEGIVTMRKGERSIFTIPPELAYGETGSESSPFIPPNSTLIFDIELISWYPIRDITSNGGILKKILKEGEGWATPNDADEVLVKYVAKYENYEVVSRSDEGAEFSITSGHLCPAISKAVKTMRKGEITELHVKSSYGIEYCEKSISNLDSNSTPYPNLIINLELVSWRRVIDIRGDKKILKKIRKTGEGFDRPNDGSLAKVICIGKLEDGTIFEKKGSDEEPFEYVCGEENNNEALDAAIMSMKKAEEAIVNISSDLLNDTEAKELSSANSISYEIKLVDFIKEKPFWKMDAQERIAACEMKKLDGNKLFKAGKFQLASKKYEKAYEYIEYSHSFTDEEKLEANSLRLSCYLNIAACKLKLGAFHEVSKHCTKVLELDPHNIKALFRRSQAYVRTSDLDKAEDDINRALSVDPNIKDLKIKQKELKEIQKWYDKHEAKIFSTMISRIS